MGAINKEYDYFVSGNSHLLELESQNKDICLGIYLTDDLINIRDLPENVKKLRKVLLSCTFIPFIDKSNKIRLSTVLYQDGISDLYDKMNITKLTDSKSVKISDVLQHYSFSIIPPNVPMTKNINIPNSQARFIACGKFFYYLRAKSTNTILFVGLN